MKSILAVILLFSFSSYAQKSSVGEKLEPQCGEPCTTCPGGIRKCDKTLNTAPRSPKVVDELSVKSRNNIRKSGSSKQ